MLTKNKVSLLLDQYKKHFLNLEESLEKHSFLYVGGTLALASTLIFWRRPDILIHAQFWAEDGPYWYASVYNHGWHALFYAYGGYLVFIPHFIALCSLLLPFHLAPLFFNLVAIGIQLSPLLLINSSRLRGIIPYRSTAILISFLYVSVLNSTEVFGNLTNTGWHLGIAAFLILIAKQSKSLSWGIYDKAILICLSLSSPLSILLTPIAAYVRWSKRSKRSKWNLILLATFSFVQIVYILFLDPTHRVGGHPQASLRYFVEMIVGQVFMGGLLGQRHVNMFYGHPLVLGLLLILGISLIIYAVRKGPSWLKLLNLYSCLIFLSMLFSLKAVRGFDVWWGLANPGGGQRYWYIPILAWIMTLLWLAVASRFMLPRVTAVACLVLLISVGIPGGWRLTPLTNLHFQAYERHFESLPKGTTYTIPVNPGWKMALTKH